MCANGRTTGDVAQHATNTDQKHQSRIYRQRRAFNELVKKAHANWHEAPDNWKKPVELPLAGLYSLDADHPIHQDFGEPEDSGPLKRWHSDEKFFASVNAMQVIRGTTREFVVLQREKSSLQFWANEELAAVDHALREAGMFLSYYLTAPVQVLIMTPIQMETRL